MRQSGKITAKALKKVLENVKVGVNCLTLEKIAQDCILQNGGQSSFKTVEGYNFTSCITVGSQVVHGIPSDRKLADGEIVSIDLGAMYNGWHTDAAWSMLVGHNLVSSEKSENAKFLKIGEEALTLGIKQAVAGNKIGDISSAIQEKVEQAIAHKIISGEAKPGSRLELTEAELV